MTSHQVVDHKSGDRMLKLVVLGVLAVYLAVPPRRRTSRPRGRRAYRPAVVVERWSRIETLGKARFGPQSCAEPSGACGPSVTSVTLSPGAKT